MASPPKPHAAAARPAPCGSWRSPLTARRLTEASLRFGDLVVDGDAVYWIEARPEEKGRSGVVRGGPDGSTQALGPQGVDVRSLVNSYGGAAYSVDRGEIVFTAYQPAGAPPPWDATRDQRLCRLTASGEVEIVADTPGSFWADAAFDRARGRLIVVREDQTERLHGQPRQTLVAVDLAGGAPTTLVTGDDFYAYPRISPDGRRLAWLTWRYPDMPWDSAEVWLAEIGADGGLEGARRVAGGPDEAAMQPEWSPEGWLCFASDRTGWWNLYRLSDGGEALPLYTRAAEFAEPLWGLGSSRYGFLADGRIACAFREGGRWSLGILDPTGGALTPIPTPYTEISQVKTGAGFVAFCGAGPEVASALARYEVASGETLLYRQSHDLPLGELAPWLSDPEPFTFPTRDGGEAHAFFYAPQSPDFTVPEGELPPLIVKSHGGPTGWANTGLSLSIQYFTSRGFAVVDVDYRGSAGYGRDYRLALYGHWGERDIFDCADAASHLIAAGRVDGRRVVASGGSAGGYITLGLVAFTDLCRAGTSYYGISSLEMIVQHSDKLEAFYPFKLIGPWPEAADLYRARSPLHRVDEVRCPVCFFQGLEDPVVPPAQTREMVRHLKAQGVPVAAVYFAGEQHGFRDVENVRRSMEGELSFYAQVLGFTPADDIPVIEIEGL